MGQAEGKPSPTRASFPPEAFRHFREEDGTWQFRPTEVKDPYADAQRRVDDGLKRYGGGIMDHCGAMMMMDQHTGRDVGGGALPHAAVNREPQLPPHRSGSGLSPLGIPPPSPSPQLHSAAASFQLGSDAGAARPWGEEVTPLTGAGGSSANVADELRQRMMWAEGSVLEVFSSRLNRWLVASVSQVGQPTPEMLLVQFSADGTKLLQKCLARNDMQLAIFRSHTTDLPPGFHATPSKSRPGQVSYMDTNIGAKFQTPELAWKSHYERMRQQAAGQAEQVGGSPMAKLPSTGSHHNNNHVAAVGPPSAAKEEQEEVARQRVIQSVFNACDRDRNGFLNEAEMRIMVRSMGFGGTDAKWTQLWQSTCKETGADPVCGLDVQAVAWHMRKAPLSMWCKVLEQLEREAAGAPGGGGGASMRPVAYAPAPM